MIDGDIIESLSYAMIEMLPEKLAPKSVHHVLEAHYIIDSIGPAKVKCQSYRLWYVTN